MTRKKTPPQDAASKVESPPEGEGKPAAKAPPEESLGRAPEERDEHLERLQRVQADFDNYRKRTERERHEWRRQGIREFLRDLLPILDDLERALDASRESEGDTSLYRGVEMILSQLLKQLQAHGLAVIDAAGKPFDPVYHDAVLQVESREHPDRTVLEDLRKGYTVEGHVIRPAQVKISSTPARAPTPESTGGGGDETPSHE